MNRLVGVDSQRINQSMKYLMYIAIIQCLLGEIVLYESVYIINKYNVFCNNFLNTELKVPFYVHNYTLKYFIKSFLIDLIAFLALQFILYR